MKRYICLGVGLALLALTVIPAGSPVQVSYVYSESMEPTIPEGDGYILGPVDTIDRGDIVTFRSAKRGEYVTHRVVGHSEQGYITQGDNNPTTDQASGYAHVSRDAIVGEVVTFQNRPVTVPHLRGVVTTAQSTKPFLLGGVALVLAWQFLRNRSSSEQPERTVTRVRDFVRPMFAAGLAVLVALTLLGATTQAISFVVVAGESDASHAVAVDEPATDTVHVRAASTALTTRVVSVEGARVTERHRNGSAVVVDIVVPPQAEPGLQTARVSVYKYPGFLPVETLEWLHGVHPLLAALVASSLTLAPLGLVTALYFDGGTPLRSSRTRRIRRSRGGSR